jgi:hypothetical protein
LRGLGLLAVAAVLLPGHASAQSATSLGTVTRVCGQVMLSRGAPDKMGTLAFKDAVFDRDRIGTGERSSARLLFGGKAVVTVRELSSLALADQVGLASLHLASGTVALAVARQRMRAEESVEVHLPGARASTRGAVLIAEASWMTDPAVSAIHVLSGRVEVTAVAGTLLLAGHQSVTITDGVIGPIRALNERDLEQLAGDLGADRLRRGESTSGFASGSGCCIGKTYPALKAEGADSVTSVTGKSMPIGFELPKGLILPIGPPHGAKPGVTTPALPR